MKIKNWKLKIFLLFTFYFLLSVPQAHAQSFSLSLWPPLLEVMIQPGKTITQVYEITNQGENPQEITPQIVSFKPLDDKGNVRLLLKNFSPLKFSLANSNLELGQSFILEPLQKQQIVLKIKVPEKTPEQDFYFSLLFSSSAQAKKGTFGSTAAGVLGSHILLTVSKTGQPEKRGEILEFKTKKIIDSLEKPEFSLRVKNTGHFFWKPFGKIKIEGLAGQSWEIPLREDNILSGWQRQIQTATGSKGKFKLLQEAPNLLF